MTRAQIFTLGLLLTAPIFASCHCHCQNGGHFLSHVINYPLAYRGHTTVLAPSYGSHQGGCSIYSGAGIQGYYPKGHGPNYGRYYDTSYYPSDSSAEAAAAASTFTSNAGSSSATAASAASAARGSSGIISYSHGPKCDGYYGTSYYYPGSSAESASASASASSASTSNSGSSSVAEATATSAARGSSGSSSVAEATASSTARGSSGIISYSHGPKCGGYYDTSYNYPGSSAESAAASSASASNSDTTSAAAASANLQLHHLLPHQIQVHHLSQKPQHLQLLGVVVVLFPTVMDQNVGDITIPVTTTLVQALNLQLQALLLHQIQIPHLPQQHPLQLLLVEEEMPLLS
ncbi:unnamed protein product [Timema podura]|uniref:Uncharacterized protein n=1 Tax=Timema podura TaxID=61482 RepID=A0ABN7NKF5_TIMPD|nr:unnamed protein product [Timema podura]